MLVVWFVGILFVCLFCLGGFLFVFGGFLGGVFLFWFGFFVVVLSYGCFVGFGGLERGCPLFGLSPPHFPLSPPKPRDTI